MSENPYDIFHSWLKEAESGSGMRNPNAMSLATVGSDGKPSLRTVLLKAVNEEGFSFFTNYESRKGRELDGNPHAALCFYWDKLARQVRVEGAVTRLPKEKSEAYFALRPRGSQLGAWASKQSREIPSREFLEEKMREAEARFPDKVPIPPYWGGYLLKPTSIEFWIEQPSRLHDRFLFLREGSGWKKVRLSP